MVPMIQANWPILAFLVVVLVLLVLWLVNRSRQPRDRSHRPDVLDEGAAPAQRNQALIDAPPIAAVAAPTIVSPPAAGTFAGVGEAVAHGAREEVQAAKPVPQAESTSHTKDVPSPQPAPELSPQSAPVVAPTVAGEGDDLRRIKGVGPKLVATLHALGVTRYAQIAAWTDADLDALDAKLGAFAGRPRRDSWVEQAQLLSGGDTAAYEAKFGKL